MKTYDLLTDYDLYLRLRESDKRAFSELYRRFAIPLLNHAFLRLHDREVSRDIVQDTFYLLWLNRNKLQIKTNVSGFLFRSVSNAALNHIARQGVESRYTQSLEAYSKNWDPNDHADRGIREKQFSAIIEKEIALLTPKMKAAFELSRVEHLSHDEIAKRLNISHETVSKHISNALKILRGKLRATDLLILFYFFL